MRYVKVNLNQYADNKLLVLWVTLLLLCIGIHDGMAQAEENQQSAKPLEFIKLQVASESFGPVGVLELDGDNPLDHISGSFCVFTKPYI